LSNMGNAGMMYSLMQPKTPAGYGNVVPNNYMSDIG